jgi:hypothetical protein
MMLAGLYPSPETAQETAEIIIPDTHSFEIIKSPKLSPTMRKIVNSLAGETASICVGTYVRGPMYHKVRENATDFEGYTVRSDIFQHLFRCGILKRLPKQPNVGSIVDQYYVLSRGARANYLSDSQ